MKRMIGMPTRRINSGRTSHKSSERTPGLPQKQRTHTGPVGGAPSRRLQAAGLPAVLTYLRSPEATCV